MKTLLVKGKRSPIKENRAKMLCLESKRIERAWQSPRNNYSALGPTTRHVGVESPSKDEGTSPLGIQTNITIDHVGNGGPTAMTPKLTVSMAPKLTPERWT